MIKGGGWMMGYVFGLNAECSQVDQARSVKNAPLSFIVYLFLDSPTLR